jgi:hypothetical protein
MAASAIPVPPGRGLLRVVSNQQLADAARAQEKLNQATEPELAGIVKHIRDRFERAVRHRRQIGIDDELIAALRAYNGEYHPTKLQEIKTFGGSEIYARVTASKCRGATALLRDIYMANDRPWSLSPSPDPTVPDGITNDIDKLVQAEAISLEMGGQPAEGATIEQRKEQLYDAAKQAERKRAKKEAEEAQRSLDDYLLEGRFYEALSAFLADLPVYSIAAIKGPVVRKVSRLRWENGRAQMRDELGFFWDRVSPFDLWFSPGASSIRHTETFERQRFTVQELYDLIGVPGYKEEAIREVITTFDAKGFKEWSSYFEYERDKLEKRDDLHNDSGFVEAVEYNGYVLGKYLKEWGLEHITEDEKPYFVTGWLIDRHVIKVMLNPSPRKRVPYYITSYDKHSGSIYGDGIPELIEDVQDVMNATLRALVNNMSIASGPQVAYNEELINPTQGDSLYPWKRWKFTTDPANPNARPIEFFQPQSNANELLSVYERFLTMADETSAIPRYMTGSEKVGGAGRTASGLAMLMNNANKTLQNVAENIDEDVMQPIIEGLYDLVMLTDPTGMLRGDEQIIVNGVRNVAKQEQDRVRQLEFLQLTANPIDAPILGQQRATVLQKVADRLGLDVDIPEPGETTGAAATPQAVGAPPMPGGASFNPAGGAAPNGGVSDNAQPRLEAVPQTNTVSHRNNMS